MKVIATIRAALEELPERCRYHGDATEPRDRMFGREACCDTGIPARRRKLAEQALRALEAAPQLYEARVDGGPTLEIDEVTV